MMTADDIKIKYGVGEPSVDVVDIYYIDLATNILYIKKDGGWEILDNPNPPDDY